MTESSMRELREAFVWTREQNSPKLVTKEQLTLMSY